MGIAASSFFCKCRLIASSSCRLPSSGCSSSPALDSRSASARRPAFKAVPIISVVVAGISLPMEGRPITTDPSRRDTPLSANSQARTKRPRGTTTRPGHAVSLLKVVGDAKLDVARSRLADRHPEVLGQHPWTGFRGVVVLRHLLLVEDVVDHHAEGQLVGGESRPVFTIQADDFLPWRAASGAARCRRAFRPAEVIRRSIAKRVILLWAEVAQASTRRAGEDLRGTADQPFRRNLVIAA